MWNSFVANRHCVTDFKWPEWAHVAQMLLTIWTNCGGRLQHLSNDRTFEKFGQSNIESGLETEAEYISIRTELWNSQTRYALELRGDAMHCDCEQTLTWAPSTLFRMNFNEGKENSIVNYRAFVPILLTCKSSHIWLHSRCQHGILFMSAFICSRI